MDLAAAQGNTKAIKLRDDLLKTTEEQSNSFASLSSVPSKPTDKIVFRAAPCRGHGNGVVT